MKPQTSSAINKYYSLCCPGYVRNTAQATGLCELQIINLGEMQILLTRDSFFSANPTVAFSFAKHGLESSPDGMTIDTDGNLWVAAFWEKGVSSLLWC